MIESSRAIQILRRYEGRENVVLTSLNGAVMLTLVRAPLRIEVTVAETVFEWFLDVVDESSGLRASDWCEHHGSSKQELDREMATAIAGFLDPLFDRELRVRQGKRPDRSVLEWLVKGEWRRAKLF